MDSSSIKKSLKVPSYICGLLRIFNTWNLYNISFFRPNCLEGCSFIKCECTKWSKTMFVIYVEKVLLRAVFYQPIWKVPILKSKNLFVTSAVQNSIPWQLYTVTKGRDSNEWDAKAQDVSWFFFANTSHNICRNLGV